MKSKQVQEFKETEIGKIPADWTVEKLQDHLIIKGRIGWKGLKKSEFSETGDCIIVNGIDIKNGEINWDSCLRVPKWRYDESPEIKLRNGDILMTKDGTIGKTCFLYDLTENATVASGIFIIRNNSEILLQNFFFAYLNSFYFKALVNTRIEGSVIPHLYQRDLTQLLIPLPTLPEQEKICSHIENLNSKIKNLQNQNKILEQIAQAIFKSWFVDFDGHTEFEDSELGQIPKGWKSGKIKDVIKIFDGKRIPLSSMERIKRKGNFPYYGATKIIDFIDDYIFDGTFLLLGEDGSVIHDDGTPFVQYVNGKIWVNNHTHVIQGKIPFNTEFIYLFFKNLNIDPWITGTTQLKINQTNLLSIPIIIPNESILKKFNQSVSPVFSNILENEKSISILTKIRDALLPKLMSGEIRV